MCKFTPQMPAKPGLNEVEASRAQSESAMWCRGSGTCSLPLTSRVCICGKLSQKQIDGTQTGHSDLHSGYPRSPLLECLVDVDYGECGKEAEETM